MKRFQHGKKTNRKHDYFKQKLNALKILTVYTLLKEILLKLFTEHYQD